METGYRHHIPQTLQYDQARPTQQSCFMIQFVSRFRAGGHYQWFLFKIKSSVLWSDKWYVVNNKNEWFTGWHNRCTGWNKNTGHYMTRNVFFHIFLVYRCVSITRTFINRTIFGRWNPARRLNCVSISRNPLGHFCYSQQVRVIETHLYFDPIHTFFGWSK